ncbi:hypothetical protein, partial [Candidatus Venteria ishoeyi]
SIHVTPKHTGKSSRILPLAIPLYWLPLPIKMSPSALNKTNDANYSFRDVHIPCDLYSTLCTLHLSCSRLQQT